MILVTIGNHCSLMRYNQTASKYEKVLLRYSNSQKIENNYFYIKLLHFSTTYSIYVCNHSQKLSQFNSSDLLSFIVISYLNILIEFILLGVTAGYLFVTFLRLGNILNQACLSTTSIANRAQINA